MSSLYTSSATPSVWPNWWSSLSLMKGQEKGMKSFFDGSRLCTKIPPKWYAMPPNVSLNQN
jgi:hypothetical protein